MEIKKEDLETLLDIEPISESHVPISIIEQIKEVVEKPLLPACRELYKKNIRTIMSSANKNNVQEEHDLPPFIILDYDQLSQENKKIAGALGEVYPEKKGLRNPVLVNRAYISISVDRETTVSEFQSRSLKLMGLFKKQYE